MLLNYWCCFRTPKCETGKNLCIINICRLPELRYTSEAVSSSCEMICKELKDWRTRRFFCSFHLHREMDHQAYLRQIKSDIYSSIVFTGLIKKKISLWICGSLFLAGSFYFFSQKNLVWSGRLLLFCSQMFPPSLTYPPFQNKTPSLCYTKDNKIIHKCKMASEPRL